MTLKSACSRPGKWRAAPSVTVTANDTASMVLLKAGACARSTDPASAQTTDHPHAARELRLNNTDAPRAILVQIRSTESGRGKRDVRPCDRTTRLTCELACLAATLDIS